MAIYNEKLKPFSNKLFNYKVKKEKNNFLTDYKKSYFPKFSFLLSANNNVIQ